MAHPPFIRTPAALIGPISVLGLLLSSCAWLTLPSAESPVTVEPPAPPGANAPAPPDWRPGDQWIYEWKSGAESGIKTVRVTEIRHVRNMPFYMARIGELQHLWTPDLQWAGTVRDQKVESRMTPPHPWFVWPLEVGRRWNYHGTYEDSSGAVQFSDSFTVLGTEVVEVPAGRFTALKIVREADRRDSDEYWYVPEIRFYARWIGRRGSTQFEEKLREYRAAPRLIPGESTAPPPSRTK